MPWFDVEITDDGDELRRYAVEAEHLEQAKQIALAAMPEPDVQAVPLYGDPDEDSIDYDGVFPANPEISPIGNPGRPE